MWAHLSGVCAWSDGKEALSIHGSLPFPWNLVPGSELEFETTAHTVVSKHLNTASTPNPQTLNPKQLRCVLLDDSVPQFRAKRQPTSISDLLSAYIWLEFLSLAMNTCQMSMRGAPSAGACASFHWRMRRAFGGESGEREREWDCWFPCSVEGAAGKKKEMQRMKVSQRQPFEQATQRHTPAIESRSRKIREAL